MITELQNQINQALQYQDPEMAIQLLSQMRAAGKVDFTDPDVLQLGYVRMNSLSANQLAELFRNSVLAAYQIEEFNLYERFKEYLVQYNYVPDEVELCRKLSDLLKSSQEAIGTQSINLNGRSAQPTLASWIEDYEQSQAKQEKDVLRLIQYLNTSANVKTLSVSERAILKNILELHDYCNQIVTLWSSLPEEVEGDDIRGSEAKVDWDGVILGLSEPDNQALETSQPRASESAASQVAQAPLEHFPEAGIYSEQVEPRQAASPNLQVNPVARPTAQQRKIMQDIAARAPDVHYGSEGANIRDLINHKTNEPRGLVLTRETNVKVDEEKQRLVEQRQQKADDIQTKLEELRKRKK